MVEYGKTAMYLRPEWKRRMSTQLLKTQCSQGDHMVSAGSVKLHTFPIVPLLVAAE